jgi:hypothetical protein
MLNISMPARREVAPAPMATGRLHVSWPTVGVFAAVITFVDGFWVTSLQGAVGAIEGTQHPLTRWIRDSTLMLPLLFVAVLAAMSLTRRWVGHSHREFRQLAVAALLVVVITSVVSLAQVTTMSVHDYNIQAAQLGQIHGAHASTVATDPGAVATASSGTCTALCAARHATLMAHVRSVGYAGLVLLFTNLVLVVWVLALRGGRLWAEGRLVDEPADIEFPYDFA